MLPPIAHSPNLLQPHTSINEATIEVTFGITSKPALTTATLAEEMTTLKLAIPKLATASLLELYGGPKIIAIGPTPCRQISKATASPNSKW